MKKIILWGATGQSIVLEEFLSSVGYELVAVFDNNPEVKSPFPEIPIYHGIKGLETWKQKNKAKEVFFLVAMGGERGKDRQEIQALLIKHGLTPATVVHPTAFVARNASIGKGSQIMAHATICARAKIGDACLINTSASVDHECIIENGVHIAPGAKLAGCVTIGQNSFVGIGAIILPRIKIGKNTIVGAGAVVTKDVPYNVVAYGNPAKIIRPRSEHE